jgi:hypothetical protein
MFLYREALREQSSQRFALAPFGSDSNRFSGMGAQ